MQGVFLDNSTLDQQDLDFSIITSTLPNWKLWGNTTTGEIDSRIESAAIVVTNKVPMLANTLEKASQCRCICIAATGSDHIDLKTANALGITVCNVQAYSTASVIQHTIGLLMSLASKISEYDNLVKQGAWVKAKQFCLQDYKTMEIAGKTLGIVGYGAIGKGVASVAQSMGMKIMVANREGQTQPGRFPLATVLSQADVLTLHCPLIKETHHLIGVRELAMMKPTALLLNVSRGGLVDEQALADALCNGRLAGAALDVVSKEPPSVDSPLFSRSLPNLLVTPHVAWATREARNRLLNGIATNIRNFLANAPTNVLR